VDWWRRVVDVGVLQDIIDRFACSQSFAAILTTLNGESVTAPSNFSEFCKRVRAIPEGRDRCWKSDARGGKMALDSGDVKIYRCHCGLIDMAVPISLADGRVIGILLMGQVHLSSYDRDDVLEMARFHWDFLPEEEMDEFVDLFLRIPVVDEEEIHRSASLLKLVASHIVNLCERYITEKSFWERGMVRMRKMVDRELLEKSLKAAQLRSLQRQLNPHFIFNTLNVIYRLAMLEGATQTRDLTLKFSEYLRYVLGKQRRSNLVSLSE